MKGLVMEESRVTLENACAEFEPDLVLYYYGDGTEAERRRVEAHLQGCSRCDKGTAVSCRAIAASPSS